MKKEGRDGPEISIVTNGAQTHGWWRGLGGNKESENTDDRDKRPLERGENFRKTKNRQIKTH